MYKRVAYIGGEFWKSLTMILEQLPCLCETMTNLLLVCNKCDDTGLSAVVVVVVVMLMLFIVKRHNGSILAEL